MGKIIKRWKVFETPKINNKYHDYVTAFSFYKKQILQYEAEIELLFKKKFPPIQTKQSLHRKSFIH